MFNELTIDEFADAFSQNLIYGIFLGKLNADARTVTLSDAEEFISVNFELIRELEDPYSAKDPYIYFYEDFLAAYDKKLRNSKAVYYTPPQIVNFIVRSANMLLKDVFRLNDGLADREKVTILDFAAGTGTFLLEVIKQIFKEYPNQAEKDLIIREHILKNLYGFEYLIAPYTIAHLNVISVFERSWI